jgi:DNA primase
VSERVRAGRRTVDVTHPDKVLFPRPKLTKLDLARRVPTRGGSVTHVLARDSA